MPLLTVLPYRFQDTQWERTGFQGDDVLPYSLKKELTLPRWEKLLLLLLSIIAGLVDVISFLTLKIFAAHVTGNLVLIAALVVGGRKPNLDQDIAVPVFIFATGAVWLIAKTSGLRGLDLAKLLLVVQFVLLIGVLVISLQCRPSVNPKGPMFTLDATTAISAMACQFALLRLIMPNAPSTAVMTGNLSAAVLAILDVMASEPIMNNAKQRLRKQLTLLLGFFGGCTAGGAAVLSCGDWAWFLPVLLAAAAILLAPKP
jgi:uncharacterized membrane protein YoaK (UPF0700 family)